MSTITKRSKTPIRTPRAAAEERQQPTESDGADPREYLPETSIGIDPLSEALAEATVERATGADDPEEDLRDQPVDEETGGPFVITTGSTEFAPGSDASNPPEALREPRPKV